MTIDKAKLKALAQKVADLEDQPELEGEHREAYDELWLHMHCHTILDLISETEGLAAQHGRDSVELRKLCAARDSARRERDNLKSEVKALRKDAERYRWLRSSENQTIFTLDARIDDHIERLPSIVEQDLDAAIDSEMSK